MTSRQDAKYARKIEHHDPFIGLVVAAVLAVALVSPAGGVDNAAAMSEILERHGIFFNLETARQAAVEGMLRAIDPRARILTQKEVLQMQTSSVSSASSANGTGTVAVATAEEWPEGITYVKLGGLHRGSGEEIVMRLRSLAKRPDLAGIVMDGRGAAGEDLDSVDEVAGLFPGPDPVLFRVQDGTGKDVAVHTKKDVPPLGAPAMLLVDGDTASAPEVLAAVLNRCRGVMLIGACTRGDALLRELIPLPDERFLHIATRRVVLGDGSTYHGVGAVPDVQVRPGSLAVTNAPPRVGKGTDANRHAEALAELLKRVGSDAALGRAVDILLGLKALGIHADGRATPPAR